MAKITCAGLLLIAVFNMAHAQKVTQSLIPKDFVRQYYQAYSGVPKAARLSPFYADSTTIDDPTYDWVGNTKTAIFKNFDQNNLNNHYTWRIDQQISQDNKLVTEGLLSAVYGDIPYEMRFVNIFWFENGKIVKQYDYYDNKDWYKAVEEWKKRQQEK
ncbi:nuclear transport factor 2 family protein [Foetidibacter luteolus]|uniref:nuclear transport factor 2 family protein n=1 Tax=Foetidibacter luteolus TaxID=2608880 RepID=UPI00129A8B86|nr:nuclear transport factor 2 family protein [Foetidibacter luteolus]